MPPIPRLKPFRIALISLHTSPIAELGGKKTGGMNVYVYEVAREMARRGIDVDIFTRVASPDDIGRIEQVQDHMRVIFMPCGMPVPLSPDEIFMHVNEFCKAALYFAQRHRIQYDFIYSHYWLSGWVALQLKQAWRIPVAQMFHTLGRMKNRIADNPTLADDVRITGETQVMAGVDRIIAATPAEQAQLLLLYKADRRIIDIVPPGVDTTRFYPDNRAEAMHKVGWDTHKKHMLFVGRIERLKGVENILEAVNHIRQDNAALAQDIAVHIIGGDPLNAEGEMERLQVLRKALGLQEYVHFIGAKGQDVLPDYYRAAEALIMPSDYESFGMVALEAMASGTPVIASEVGGLAFLIQDAVTGFHVPVREPSILADRITRIVTNPDLRTELGNAAFELAQGYRWGRIVDQLLETFMMLGMRPQIYRLP